MSITMTEQTLFSGEQIKELIPQRSPILMVDAFYNATADEANTGLTLKEDNLFLSDNKFTEPGLIEHIAQSASAFAGYNARLQGKGAPIGYIGEIKKFNLISLPNAGDTLRTHIHIVSVVGNVSLLQAETKVNDSTVCTTNMKIAIEE